METIIKIVSYILLLFISWVFYSNTSFQMTGGYNSFNAIVTFVILFVVYFIISSLFAYVDLKKRPIWLHERKYQKDTCLLAPEYCQAFMRTLIKFLVVLAPFFLVVFFVMNWRVKQYRVFRTKNIWAFTFAVLISFIIADFMAWGIHKLLHKGILWDKIHSIHHKYISTVAVASLDAHPIEIIFWDVMPFIVGPFILGLDPSFLLIFGILSIINTTLVHSGYDIGFDNGHHDLHHEKLKCNYSFFLSDFIMGTIEYREKDKIYPRYDFFQKDIWGSLNNECKFVGEYHRAHS